MLKLRNISKDYILGTEKVAALKNINLDFKANEFVSIIGPSGCGKTTLLNLIGGLDQYSNGDLLIDGKSTKHFNDRDWDAYRNGTVGFVFQNYNLISHLSVLDNVAMSLSLSGVGAKERVERATKMLIEVGLENQKHKRPNQLSGGQMQRVAIARALINNPKVLLADEPTGALDSKTSVQILDLIKKISHGRLVIMVTHNDGLAAKYSDRIVRLLDGVLVEDLPVDNKYSQDVKEELHVKRTAMSYLTALKTSFKNLLTKKARTIITAFAGSIGIIGIALVLAISGGMTNYTNRLQSDALAGFPVTISQTTSTTSGTLNRPGNTMGDTSNDFPSDNVLHAYDRSEDTVTHTNLIDQDYLDYLSNINSSWVNSISYSRSVSINILARTSADGYMKVNTVSSSGFGFLTGVKVFNEIPDSREFIESQYDLLGSNSVYPTTYQQLALIVDEQNRIDVAVLNAFGIDINDNYNLNDFIGKQFKVIPNDDYYQSNMGLFTQRSDYEVMYQHANAITIEISAIMRIKSTSPSALLSTGIGYTTALTDHILDLASSSSIVAAQEASPTINVLSGQPFNSQVTYKSIMKAIGGDAIPSGIQIYPVSFETKDLIKVYLDAYNADKEAVDKIIYSDLATTISNTISSLISTITLILMAFAAISLVVSSIMIGIITYVSVVERTKEIGIMRAIGARKKDISRIFNAEAILIGLVAGTLGVLVAVLLSIPISVIVSRFVDANFMASISLLQGIGLIGLSVALTFIAGLIPARIASRRDPVVALRTE